MYVCMYVCMNTCIYTYTHTHTHTRTYVYTHAYIHMYMYVNIYTHQARIRDKAKASKGPEDRGSEPRWQSGLTKIWKISALVYLL
jgi:hypothetical protein